MAVVVAFALVQDYAYALPPWLAVLSGLLVTLLGIGTLLLRRPITSGLNRMYGALPGGLRYPQWWFRMLGTALTGFGLLVTGLSLFFWLR